MKKDFRLSVEKLDNRNLLSANLWYIEAIHADNIWNSIPTQSSKPVVAIVDSGADLNHPLIKNNLWHNPVDNSVGYDFVQVDNDPTGGYYHGTHVAGIIETVSHNSVDLMILRFMDDNGVGYTGGAAAAIDYATMMKNKGINVVAINCSFGGLSYNPSNIDSAIKRASDSGISVILAAGNDGVDLDISPRYPGNINYTNTITVGSINVDLSWANYSSYGKNTVTVAAPGTSIYSSLPNNNYGYISGTSMATAVVSGEVGLLATLGKYSANQIKNAIIQGCGVLSGFVDRIKCGFIDVSKSWNLLKDQKPVLYTAPSVPLMPISKLTYALEIVNKSQIKGWAKLSNSSVRPVVEVYINNVLRYSVIAKLYRYETKTADGFQISIYRRFLNLKKNLIEVRIINPMNKSFEVAYRNYLLR